MSDVEQSGKDERTATVPGRRCANCQHFSLSPVQVCPVCLGTDLHADDIPGQGVVYSATVIRSGPRDRTVPYGLAYVDLTAGVRVLAGYPADEHVGPGDAVAVSEVDRTEAGLPLLAVVEGASEAA